MISGLPFDDFRHLVTNVGGADEAARTEAAAVNRHAAERDGPAGEAALISEWLAAWSGRRPGPLKPQIAIFAGTHDLAQHLPADIETVQSFVERCGTGGAAINQLCAAGDYGLKVFDLALDVPVGDFTVEAALDERGCAATMAFGMEAIAGANGLVVLAGHGGRSGSLSARTLLEALKMPVADTSPAESALQAAALSHHAVHLADPLEALRRLGGREIAALAGAILAARTQKVPVLLDGISALAAAATLHALNREAVAHCMVADGAGAFGRIARALGLQSVIQLGMQTSDAAAGAIAAGVVQAAAFCHAAAGASLRRR